MSNTINSGIPKERERVPLAGAAAAIIFGLFVLIQVSGVLYALLFPPDGPARPQNTAELSRRNEGYGVDQWLYGTTQDPCLIIEHFGAAGGVCQTAPLMCGEARMAQSTPAQQVGSCSGEMRFSLFALRWEVRVSRNNPGDWPTQFTLRREVYWTTSNLPSQVTPALLTPPALLPTTP